MLSRDNIVELVDKINQDNPTSEMVLMSLILNVLLDIRDQNDIMLDQQLNGYRNGP